MHTLNIPIGEPFVRSTFLSQEKKGVLGRYGGGGGGSQQKRRASGDCGTCGP